MTLSVQVNGDVVFLGRTIGTASSIKEEAGGYIVTDFSPCAKLHGTFPTFSKRIYIDIMEGVFIIPRIGGENDKLDIITIMQNLKDRYDGGDTHRTIKILGRTFGKFQSIERTLESMIVNGFEPTPHWLKGEKGSLIINFETDELINVNQMGLRITYRLSSIADDIERNENRALHPTVS